MIQQPILLRNTNPHHLVSSFITALEGLATQSKTQMKLKFIEIETATKIKLCKLQEELNQKQRRRNSDRFCRSVYRWLWGARPI